MLNPIDVRQITDTRNVTNLSNETYIDTDPDQIYDKGVTAFFYYKEDPERHISLSAANFQLSALNYNRSIELEEKLASVQQKLDAILDKLA